MELLFQLVIMAFLLLISIELLLIYRELVHSQVRRVEFPAEKEEKSPASQTINVNVASPAGLGSQGLPGTFMTSVPSQNSVSGGPAAGAAEAAAEHKSGEDGGSAASSPYRMESRTSPRTGPAASTRAAHPFAKVCPACGAENSVYRTECFNCGKGL